MPKISRIIENKFPYPPTSGQRELFLMFDELIETSRNRATLLIRGYAGTGKTASIASFVKALPLFNYKSLLLAPTGRAAKVVSNYSGHSAFTIHKIIYRNSTDQDTGELIFKRQKNNHRQTVFIVDEASMIQEDDRPGSSSILQDLINYVFEHENNKLVLIGDDAQLPPVGYLYSGALDVNNLVDKYGLDIFETSLTEVVRQEKNSGILHYATKLRKMIAGKSDKLNLNTNKFPDIIPIASVDLEEVIRKAYDEFGHINAVVICRSNRETVNMNRHIRNQILYREEDLETGDSIMIVRNNYYWLPEDSKTGFLANGDFVEVMKISNREEKYGFRFADLRLRLVDYPDQEPFNAKVMLDTLYTLSPSLASKESLDLYNKVFKDQAEVSQKKARLASRSDPYLNALQVKFTYAITCHKSQGGQWPVIFIKHGYRAGKKPDAEYLRWLYTGISRATDLCYFVDFDDKYL